MPNRFLEILFWMCVFLDVIILLGYLYGGIFYKEEFIGYFVAVWIGYATFYFAKKDYDKMFKNKIHI